MITGCTDPEATNYDESAFVDDCSCIYNNDCPAISFNSTDSGFGWQISDINGETILEYEGAQMSNYCNNYCFEDGCYIITMTSMWGNGWYQTTLDIGEESFTLSTGSEGIAAFAYNTEMNCEIGCTDPDASNYNPDAILDDGSCAIFGCTITTACNYDENATAFDGSCYYCYMDDCNTYPNELYDCNGECLDENLNGIPDCDETVSMLENTDFTWEIFPNPLANFTTLKFTNPNSDHFNIRIISLSGKIIYSRSTRNSEHVIYNKFASGYYIIELESYNKLVRKKLIIE